MERCYRCDEFECICGEPGFEQRRADQELEELEEPDPDDTLRCCPNCEFPNQYGNLCAACQLTNNAGDL